MLQKLREKTSGWIASVILGLLTIPFAFFGVEQYMQGRTETWAAKVEAPPTWWEGAPTFWPASTLWQREEISTQDFRTAFENARLRQRQQMGDQYDARAFDTPENKRALLDQLIDRKVLEMAADRAGIAVSNDRVAQAIATAPAYQVDGKFSRERYLFELSRSGQTAAQIENETRREEKVALLPESLAESAFATKSEVDRLITLTGEQRSVTYVQLPPAAPDTGPVAGKEIDAFYRAHRGAYRAPEQVTIEYVELDAASMPVPPADEATLRQRYADEKARLAGQEQRLVSHILVAVPANADAATQKAAEAKAAKIAADAKVPGADFAALARADSDDNISKAQGGDLGWVGKGGMPSKAFEDAVYAMQPGEVRGPVKTEFGYHVILVREAKAGSQASFEDMRDQLAREQADADREHAFTDLGTKFIDAVYKNPTALRAAADSMKLPVKTLGPFSRGGGAGIAGNAAVQRAAFQESAIQDGTASDLIEIGPNHSVVLRVTQHLPEHDLPVAQVRAQIVAAIRSERAAKAVQARADAMIAKVRAGTPLAQVATAEQLVAVNAPELKRGAPMPDPATTEAMFSVPAPAMGKATPGKTTLRNGSTVVFAVTAVVPGRANEASLQDRLLWQQQLSQWAGTGDAKAFIDDMRKSMQVDIAEDRL
ncbi:peptidylprolyl isomerase [Lysobacter helvus]|uniref:Periplasmic chaperone PpiD n=2 Tax=Lysobacteraceae TaxID=32033 RepID=A0ABM7Q259_9GAMM|nr:MULTISPECIES: SurA N-terminal domain-containing protein [Lysobacter]BCT91241.1 peptidylprolyl isomerase [Lysobacter caseinilyticus]BCT94394.1 peptidylprolyl isomerase [Lysobacter helvus]